MAEVSEPARAAAFHCLQDWARVQPGERVLALRGDGDYVETGVIDAFRDATEKLQAQFRIVACPIFNPRTHEPPEPVCRALEAADVVLFFSPYPALVHSRAGRRAMFEYGLRIVPILTNTLELLGSPWARFPVELQLLLHRRCMEICQRSRQVRVTSRQGTNIQGLIPDTVSSIFRERLIPGLAWHGIWPGECGPCLEPMSNINGTIVIDVLPGFKGLLRDKIRIQVQDNRIQSIAGGKEAVWFQEFIGQNVAKGGDADHVYELQWGVNPKGDINRAVQGTDRDEVEISRIARTLHFGFGSGAHGFHWDVVLVDGFDLVIGDEPVYRDGRLVLLDDPEVRQVAARYGDPNEILAELTERAQGPAVDSDLVARARALYEPLNGLAAARRYLAMFDRNVEFRAAGQPVFHLSVQGGRLAVAAGPIPTGGERMIMSTDPGTLAALLRGEIRYAQSGGGYAGKLVCTEGFAYFPDLSWAGVLTRLAQEHAAAKTST